MVNRNLWLITKPVDLDEDIYSDDGNEWSNSDSEISSWDSEDYPEDNDPRFEELTSEKLSSRDYPLFDTKYIIWKPMISYLTHFSNLFWGTTTNAYNNN